MAMKWLHGSSTASPQYHRPMEQAFLAQLVLALLTACVMDRGHTYWCSFCAVCAHWTVIVVVLIRRPDAPTKSDLIFIGSGYLPILVLAVVLAEYFHPLLGWQSLMERWLGRQWWPPEEGITIPLSLLCVVWIVVFLRLVRPRKPDTSTTTNDPVVLPMQADSKE